MAPASKHKGFLVTDLVFSLVACSGGVVILLRKHKQLYAFLTTPIYNLLLENPELRKLFRRYHVWLTTVIYGADKSYIHKDKKTMKDKTATTTKTTPPSSTTQTKPSSTVNSTPKSTTIPKPTAAGSKSKVEQRIVIEDDDETNALEEMRCNTILRAFEQRLELERKKHEEEKEAMNSFYQAVMVGENGKIAKFFASQDILDTPPSTPSTSAEECYFDKRETSEVHYV